MSGGDSRQNHLKKLTVQQLKALCKERRISGYSKLTKAVLIQRLTESDGPLSSQTSTPRSSRTDDTAGAISQHPGLLVAADSSHHVEGSTHPPTNTLDCTAEAPQRPIPFDPGQVTDIGRSDPRSTPVSGPPSVRPSVLSLANGSRGAAHPVSQNNAVVAAKTKEKGSFSSFQGNGNSNATESSVAVFKVPAVPSKVLAAQWNGSTILSVSQAACDPGSTTNGKRIALEEAAKDSSQESRKRLKVVVRENVHTDRPRPSGDGPAMTESVSELPEPDSHAPPYIGTYRTPFKPVSRSTGTYTTPPLMTTSGVPTARFKPLVLSKPNTVSASASGRHVPMNSPIQPREISSLVSLSYLDFRPSPAISLSPIPRPPSLSQRKRIPRWAIVFSRLPISDLIVCAQVSRTLRYAGMVLSFLPSSCTHPTHSVYFCCASTQARFRRSSPSIYAGAVSSDDD